MPIGPSRITHSQASLKHVFTAAWLLASSASKLRFSQPVLLFLVARLANQRLNTVMTRPSLADRRRTNAGLVYRSGQRASPEQTQLHLCLQREAISASASGIWQNECFSKTPAKLESVDCRARFSVLEAEKTAQKVQSMTCVFILVAMATKRLNLDVEMLSPCQVYVDRKSHGLTRSCS